RMDVMQLTDWLASWLSSGRTKRRGARHEKSRHQGTRSAQVAAERLEPRTLPAVSNLIGLTDNNANGTAASSPDNLVNVNGTLFFTADDGVHGRELWRSDGTAAGTVMLKDISSSAGADPTELLNVAGTLFFTATDGTQGRELWKSDSSAAGTVLVKDIRAG